jgi:hypothetical protein
MLKKRNLNKQLQLIKWFSQKFSVFDISLTDSFVWKRNYFHTEQYQVDHRNSHSFYKVLLKKLNPIRLIIPFITAL